MAKKQTNQNNEPEEQKALVAKIDQMMSLDSKPDANVSELAASVNEKSMADTPLTGEVEVKTSAPELPNESKNTEEQTAAPAEIAPKPTETAVEPPAPDDGPLPDEYDDNETDKAVDDIVAKEADTVLAVEDARRNKEAQEVRPSRSWRDKFKSFFKNKWTWIVIGFLLVALLALPLTRYKILGLVIKKSVTVTVVDSKTKSPVSGASVELGGGTAKTDADGKATVKSSVGKRDLLITKKYYKPLKTTKFVGLTQSQNAKVYLVATGRLVPVTVTNKVTGQPLANAQIKVQGTTAKTDKKGRTQIALPVKTATYEGEIILQGYNMAKITIQVTDKEVPENGFALTPAGQVYFLSNLNGTLDVVKSNLDGSGRKTVLEGTGKEDAATTSLLASRDWRYLVLKSRRDGSQDSLSLIDTKTDKISDFDTSNSDFELIGWYDHYFVYSLTRKSSNYWQSGRQIIKSYDADHQQPYQLDQNLAEGTGSSYAYQNFINFYLVNNALVYNTQWSGYNAAGTGYDLSSKNDTIRAVQPNGQNKKDYQNFTATNVGYMQAKLYEPQGVYFGVYDNTANKTAYYEFQNLGVKSASIGQSTLDKPYPTYLLSPSGSKTFWSELRDGKNALFIGDSNATSKKQIASLSNYAPYGWYGDNYLLVSKSSSELYVMSLNQGEQPPLKVTDYYKPAQTYQGYGYGYGGL